MSYEYWNLKRLGYVKCYVVWAPRDLTKKNAMDLISICDSLFKRNKNGTFLSERSRTMKNWLFTTMWSEERSSGKRNESLLTISKEGNAVYLARLYITSFFRKIRHEFRRLPFPVQPLKAVIDEKCPEFAKIWGVSSSICRPNRNWESLYAISFYTCPTPPKLAASDYRLLWSLQNFINGKNINSLYVL